MYCATTYFEKLLLDTPISLIRWLPGQSSRIYFLLHAKSSMKKKRAGRVLWSIRRLISHWDLGNYYVEVSMIFKSFKESDKMRCLYDYYYRSRSGFIFQCCTEYRISKQSWIISSYHASAFRFLNLPVHLFLLFFLSCYATLFVLPVSFHAAFSSLYLWYRCAIFSVFWESYSSNTAGESFRMRISAGWFLSKCIDWFTYALLIYLCDKIRQRVTPMMIIYSHALAKIFDRLTYDITLYMIKLLFCF